MNDLIPLENPQPATLFAPGGLTSIVARIEADARAMVPDISTVNGRAAVASLAAKVAKAKTYLDGLGKNYTADLKRQTGAVDAERKAMRDRLDALKAEVRRPLDEWEQAETDRVIAIRERIAVFNAPYLGLHHSSFWVEVLAAYEGIDVDDSFAEFQAEAQAAKEACLYRLTVARDAELHREAEDARIAAEEDAARAKAQAEREERIAREAAEAAAKVAEARIEAERRAAAEAERRAQEAEHRAALAVQEEKERAEAERRAAEVKEAKRREDLENRVYVHNKIMHDLPLPQDLAGAVLEKLIAGQIRHVSVRY